MSMILRYPSHPVEVPPVTGFPTPSVTDDFNRATLGANYGRWWNGDSDMTITSNQATASVNDFCDNYYSVAQYQDPDVAVTINTLPAAGRVVYLGARIASPGTAGMDAYELVYTNAATDTIEIRRVNNETETSLISWNQNLANGNSIGMRVTGTGSTVTIDVYLNTGAGWSLFNTYNDTDANRLTTTGYGGIGTNSTTTRLDNYIIGNS